MCLWVDDNVILGLQEENCENFESNVSESFGMPQEDVYVTQKGRSQWR